MKDRDMDEILQQVARTPQPVNPELLDRIAASIGPSLPAVRPLPPSWAMEGGLVGIAMAIAIAGAAKFGFFGFLKLNAHYRIIIFPILVILILLAASEWVNANIPGSKRRLAPSGVFAVALVGMLAVFGSLFRDYHTRHFVSAGLVCLEVGLLHAMPVALLGWVVIRRGFAVNPISAGLVAGTLAGLAGLTMLELHCPNFQAFHILVWHVAVVPVSAGVGALSAWVTSGRRSP